MDWAGLGVVLAVFVGGMGYLSRQIETMRAELRADRTEWRAELARLGDAYLRHLEAHAAGR